MTDEIKDSLIRLKELAESIRDNIGKPRILTVKRLNYLIACVDFLEAEIEFTDK